MIFSSGSLKDVLSLGLYSMLLYIVFFILKISAGEDIILIYIIVCSSFPDGHMGGE